MERTKLVRLCVATKIWSSGTGWFATELAQGLANNGALVNFVAPALSPSSWEPSHRNITRLTPPRETTDHTAKFAARVSKLNRIVWTLYYLFIGSALSRIVIFSMPDHEVVSIPTFFMLRLLSKKVLLIVHDPLPHDFRHRGGQRFRKMLLKIQYHLASTLVVLSEAGKQEIIRTFGIPDGRIRVIPHGAFALAGGTPLPGSGAILAFGSVRRNKNVLQVIEAVKALRSRGHSVRLVLAGGADPSDEYCRACLEAASEDPDGVVNMLQFVADADLPDLVAKVDAFILAYSEFNSQSGVAVLAGLSGRPVITSFAGGIRELQAAGLVGVSIEEPICVATISKAIEEFYELPTSVWQAKAESGRARLAAELDWTAIAKRYLAL
ncbi:glycosyltransferase family 4 protein [Bradyrhizobium sp.]|uniref:glycosyltransferase family 4 protein n=1 Tax=Bradyrhizobium sp. TaxID=376 RepID=UPI003C31ECE2